MARRGPKGFRSPAHALEHTVIVGERMRIERRVPVIGHIAIVGEFFQLARRLATLASPEGER